MEVDLYYHGNIDRQAAETRLMLFSNCDGTFLIRSKDEDNYVVSVYYQHRIAHYLVVKQVDGSYMWGSDHEYESIECMVNHHTQNLDGLITLLTVGCPVKHFVYQDSLFPEHQCDGMCWFHGSLSKSEVTLRLAVTDPSDGSFLLTNSADTDSLYLLSVLVNNKTAHHRIIEKKGHVFIDPNVSFPNLLKLIEHYKTDPGLGHVITSPCCISTWFQRGHLSHPPQILTSLSSSEEEEAAAPSLQRKVAMRLGGKDKGRPSPNSLQLNLSNLSNLSLSDNDSPYEVDGMGFYNITYSSDEENKKEDIGMTLELHNTLSRKGSKRIKRKSLEKNQIKLQKIQASRSARSSSEEEIVIDSPTSEVGQNQTKLKRRNAKEKRRNRKAMFLPQSEFDQLKRPCTRLTLNPTDILWTEFIGQGVNSKVYKGTLHQVPVAIKKCDRFCHKWNRTLEGIEHDNILRLIGYEKEKIIVTELCALGSLDSFLKTTDKSTTSPLIVLSWMRDVCSALLYLEESNIPLRCLSCRHVTLTSAQSPKLSVYSTTRLFCEQGPDTHKLRWYPLDGKQCIVWSFGVTLLEAIHYSKLKYKDLLEIKYSNGVPIITFLSHVPIAVRNLIKACIRQRSCDRPKLKTVKDKMDVILDIIIKAYNWKVHDPSLLIKTLNLERGDKSLETV